MRDDGAKDTGHVATRESYTSLRGLGVVVFLAGERFVYLFDDGLEGGEFHHGVGDLAAPEGGDALVETNTQ